MKHKMGLREGFLLQTPTNVELEEEIIAETIEEEISPPPSNVTHFFKIMKKKKMNMM